MWGVTFSILKQTVYGVYLWGVTFSILEQTVYAVYMWGVTVSILKQTVYAVSCFHPNIRGPCICCTCGVLLTCIHIHVVLLSSHIVLERVTIEVTLICCGMESDIKYQPSTRGISLN